VCVLILCGALWERESVCFDGFWVLGYLFDDKHFFEEKKRFEDKNLKKIKR
jgi:hypothetical protein